MKQFLCSFAVLCLAGTGLAQTVYGTAEVVYGKHRGPNGEWQHVGGFEIPIVIEKITARDVSQPVPPKKTGLFDYLVPQDTIIYNNDRGSNYFYTPEMASALDDVFIISAGNNQKWRTLTLGVNTLRNSGTVMLRLRTWQNFTAGRGAGVSAFDLELWDYGIGINTSQFPSPGAYKFTLPLYSDNRINMRVPANQCYFAQQWREYHVLGEGTFLEGEMSPIFSGDGEPLIGTSQDLFWFDYNPAPNGIYDETEQDWFNGTPNEANFLLTAAIGQSGTLETIRPVTYQWFRGQHVGGNVGSLHFSDDNRLQGNKGIVINQNEAPIQLVTEGFASTNVINSMSFNLESMATSVGLQQTVELFNFVSGQYVLLDTRNAPTTDTTISVNVPSNPGQYVESGTNVVRAQVTYKAIGPTSISNWGCRVDMGTWDIIKP
ncbi:MAG: hypothetical protein IT207_07240 [Fimbriimonadaceae bacterium]|nr:hypothetical protein [Fimbriimonadaceae bacterium]